MTAAEGRPSGGSLVARAHASIDILYREIAKFGAVGAIAFVVDFGVFNLMRAGVIGGEHGLAEKPLTAKTISVLAATIVAWLGNRYWTFRHRRRASRRREFTLFLLMNIGGLVIALACLGFSRYLLGLSSVLADNIAGNVVGLGLGTLFRFWAYRQLVFTTPDEQNLLFDTADAAGSTSADAAPAVGLVSTGNTTPTAGLVSTGNTTPTVRSLTAATGSPADPGFIDPPNLLDLRERARPSREAPPLTDHVLAQRRQA